MLNSKQRAFLRSMAQTISPIFQVGKGGVGQVMCESISDALEARELIKVSVLENSGYAAKEAAEQIAAATGAEVVAVVGYRFVLYRPSVKKQRILLP